jgi:cbb3-type cytochrome oxidase subunit 3
MFKQFLQHIPGADFYMILSLAVFLIFFIGVGWYLFTVDKKEMDRMANIPLSGGNQNPNS